MILNKLNGNLKLFLLLGGVGFLSQWTSAVALDPWGVFIPQKIFELIGALLLIQAMGVFFVRYLGPRHGLLFVGFLGGIVSSTAMTVSLARKHVSTEGQFPVEILPFLSATLAMLLEALLFVFIGVSVGYWKLSLIFIGPILFTLGCILYARKKKIHIPIQLENEKIVDLKGTLKLVLFIVGILAVSKAVQNVMGAHGLQVLTFVVSLFEVHGSIISNTQLYNAGDLNVQGLGFLLTISIISSYISKYFLVSTLAGSVLRKFVGMICVGVSIATGLSWLLFHFVV